MTINCKKNPQVEEENFDNIAYRRLKDIPGYSPEAVNVTFFYIKIENYMGNGYDAFVRCSKKQTYDYRNLHRNTKREQFSYNKHIGNRSVSYAREVEDENGDVTVIEYEDRNTMSADDVSYLEETKVKARGFAHDEADSKIIECLLNGITKDTEISKIVGLSRSSVQERRSKLQKLFREEMSDYRDSLQEMQSRRTCQYGNKR